MPFAGGIMQHGYQCGMLWGAALALTHPMAVLWQRKIWAQSVLPLFSMVFLISWWKRATRAGAFFWGFLSAIIPQIHMSGFAYSAAFLLWTLAFDRGTDRPKTRWRAWLTGLVLGALPIFTWLFYIFFHKHKSLPFRFAETIQLKYWVFFASDDGEELIL